MKRNAVVSSNVAAIGYDPDRLILEIEFKPTRVGEAVVWQYDGVGPQVHEHLSTAVSIGREFQVVRQNYPGRCVARIDSDGVEHILESEEQAAS